MGEKQPIEPPERDNPEEPLTTEQLQEQLHGYSAELAAQRQEPPQQNPPGASAG